MASGTAAIYSMNNIEDDFAGIFLPEGEALDAEEAAWRRAEKAALEIKSIGLPPELPCQRRKLERQHRPSAPRPYRLKAVQQRPPAGDARASAVCTLDGIEADFAGVFLPEGEALDAEKAALRRKEAAQETESSGLGPEPPRQRRRLDQQRRPAAPRPYSSKAVQQRALSEGQD